MSTTLYNELLMDGVHGFLPDPLRITATTTPPVRRVACQNTMVDALKGKKQ